VVKAVLEHGKRRRRVSGKTLLFEFLKRLRKIFATVAGNCPRYSLLSVIKGRAFAGSAVHTSSRKAYDGLDVDAAMISAGFTVPKINFPAAKAI